MFSFLATMMVLTARADDSITNEYPPQGQVVPVVRPLPVDDTRLFDAPAPKISAMAGYAGYGNNGRFNSGAAIGALLFLDGGKTAVVLDTTVAAGQGGPFAYAQGDLKFRYRLPLLRNNVFYWGAGANIDGRGAGGGTGLDSYLRAQPIAFLGWMDAIEDSNHEVTCVFQAFALAGLGIYDNQNQSMNHWSPPSNLDVWARPAVGAEGLARCGSFRVIADYQHAFTLGDGGDTDRAKIELSKTWPIGGLYRLGFFTRGEAAIEHGAKDAPEGDPRGQTHVIPSLFGGFEVRFY